MAAKQVADKAVAAQESLAAEVVGADELDGRLHLAEGQQSLLEVTLTEVVSEVGLLRRAKHAPRTFQESLQEVGQTQKRVTWLLMPSDESIQVGKDYDLELL